MAEKLRNTSEEESQTYYLKDEKHEVDISDILEKNDMRVMIVSALATIVPIVLVLLLLMVLPVMLLFRVF